VVYRFGVFELDARTGELRKHGVRLRVRGRPIDILLLLLERPGDVVTREDLRQRLWPADTFVDFDHGLNSAVNRLRDALGDSADNSRFIETLPRRGYRFIAPIAAPVPRSAAPVATPPPTPPPEIEAATIPTPSVAMPVEPVVPAPVPRLRWRRASLIAAAGVAAVVIVAAAVIGWRDWRTSVDSTGKMTIAVLPFANLSGDPEQDYFSDGFTEEMIAELGTLEPGRLAVIGRTTSMLYKGAGKSIGQIGQELGVMYVLDGSVRRAGQRLRITAQLVNTRDMTSLWGDSYERDVGDVLTVQSDVARQIARALALALTPPSDAAAHRTPTSFSAYEMWMRGRFFRGQATEDGARKAIEYFERAAEVDPAYAAAHAGIADSYLLLGSPGWEVDAPSRLLPSAKEAAERALALDSESAEAHATLSLIKLYFDWDLAATERELTEALRLNPSSAQAHQYHSTLLLVMNRPEEAIAAARRAMELDPLSATASTTLGIRYFYAARIADAIEQFLKTLEVTPGFAVAHWGLAQCYRQQGRHKEAIEQLESAVQLSGNSAYMRSQLAYGYAAAGNHAAAQAVLRQLREEAGTRYVAPYHLALIAAGLGDTTQTLQWLERAYADRSGWMVFLPVQPEFDGMRQAVDFQRLLARVKPQS
jgi:TolB-like protein/DNA-binding winged helix-turn-helix (wHTH) protein/tetratricopeptide (TPR) repeat protein